MQTLINGPAGASHHFIFAHGAGAGMDHPFMDVVAENLGEAGIQVIRFEFPYMVKRRDDGKKRPPDRLPRLLEAFREQVVAQGDGHRLIIGGKSMGGRVASLLAAEEAETLGIAGVICLGFPFHPPGKPERFRGEHLASIRTPTLILQGSRDTFGRREEVQSYPFSPAVRCHFLEDGDHSFKPRKTSGFTEAGHLENAAERMASFILTF
ncbi:alpha/beta fold hydrolase [Motiliproteus sp. SC1-56]|uniref:alpha/beta fold hydrolase n=1 Tax=Motiliproteus sp. SC1-56 TaxID=2799565 RepID=UPI001A90928D|nr:alpha/beta fold hydrolase [Motiliproteus sp. SC1-56]